MARSYELLKERSEKKYREQSGKQSEIRFLLK